MKYPQVMKRGPWGLAQRFSLKAKRDVIDVAKKIQQLDKEQAANSYLLLPTDRCSQLFDLS